MVSRKFATIYYFCRELSRHKRISGEKSLDMNFSPKYPLSRTISTIFVNFSYLARTFPTEESTCNFFYFFLILSR